MTTSRLGAVGRLLSWVPVGAGSLTIVAVVVVCVPQLRVAATQALSGRPVPFRVGDAVGTEPWTYEGSELTALLFARSTCAVCSAALPYFSLLQGELTKDGRVRFLFVPTIDVSSAEVAYGAQLGLGESRVVAAPLAVRARLVSVPTLVVVDRTGRIRLMRSGGRRSPQHAVDLAAEIRAMNGQY
jgi:hypothetical protein